MLEITLVNGIKALVKEYENGDFDFMFKSGVRLSEEELKVVLKDLYGKVKARNVMA